MAYRFPIWRRDEHRAARGALERLLKAAPRGRPAPGKGEAPAAFPGKGSVGRVAIALQHAFEVDRDDLTQAGGGAAGLPVINGVSTGPVAGPEVALLGFAVAAAQVGYRRFIDPHIASAHDSGADGFVDGF